MVKVASVGNSALYGFNYKAGLLSIRGKKPSVYPSEVIPHIPLHVCKQCAKCAPTPSLQNTALSYGQSGVCTVPAVYGYIIYAGTVKHTQAKTFSLSIRNDSSHTSARVQAVRNHF
jgi:hypothetical protein